MSKDDSADWLLGGLRIVIEMCIAKKWQVVFVLVAFVGGAGVVAYTKAPIYAAVSVFVPAGVGGGSTASNSIAALGALSSIAGLNFAANDDPVAEALAVLESCDFTSRFIADLELMPEFYPKLWDADSHSWKVGVDQRPTSNKACRFFSKYVRFVSRDKRTGLIHLKVLWVDPEKAAFWANELVRRLNDEMRARVVGRAEASVFYLEEELSRTSIVATRDAISRIMEAQIKERMIANVTEDFVFRVVERAVAADKDDFVSPRRVFILIQGLMLGLSVGVISCFVWPRSKSPSDVPV